jgi:Rrf2 family transcriptional regulator, nitric oxide-sensitive transcriptional repressor
MQLTRHTDYALRLLIHLACTDAPRTIAEVASAHEISRTHLMKIANQLARLGFIETTRGRGGGIRLAREPQDISLDEVIRATEPRHDLVECGSCKSLRGCTLPAIFSEGLRAFHQVLAGYTLADLAREPPLLARKVA